MAQSPYEGIRIYNLPLSIETTDKRNTQVIEQWAIETDCKQ